MNEILTFALTLLLLIGGLAALIRYVREDVFAGPTQSTLPSTLDDIRLLNRR